MWRTTYEVSDDVQYPLSGVVDTLSRTFQHHFVW